MHFLKTKEIIGVLYKNPDSKEEIASINYDPNIYFLEVKGNFCKQEALKPYKYKFDAPDEINIKKIDKLLGLIQMVACGDITDLVSLENLESFKKIILRPFPYLRK